MRISDSMNTGNIFALEIQPFLFCNLLFSLLLERALAHQQKELLCKRRIIFCPVKHCTHWTWVNFVALEPITLKAKSTDPTQPAKMQNTFSVCMWALHRWKNLVCWWTYPAKLSSAVAITWVAQPLNFNPHLNLSEWLPNKSTLIFWSLSTFWVNSTVKIISDVQLWIMFQNILVK